MASDLRVLPEEPLLSVVTEEIKGLLPELGKDKKMKILKEFIKNPNFDYTILQRMCLEELENTSNKPAEVKKLHNPTILRIKLPSAASSSSNLSDNYEVQHQKHIVQDFTGFGILELSKPNDDPDIIEQVDDVQQENSINTNMSNMPPKLRQLLKKLKGNNPVLVIQKELFKSDVNPKKGRLSLPISQLNPRFLTQEERDVLSSTTVKNPRIKATIYDSCGEECPITLTKWNMQGSEIYNFIGTWKDVVERNRLEEGNMVQLWSFHVGSQLCFFLVKV